MTPNTLFGPACATLLFCCVAAADGEVGTSVGVIAFAALIVAVVCAAMIDTDDTKK